MKINLNYFSFDKIPNQKAHTIQILKMCDYMCELFNVNLICPKGNSKDIKKIFNLKNNFKVKNINTSKLKVINIFYKLYYLIFYKLNKDDILFTRDVHFAFLGFFFYKKIYLELHVTHLNYTNLSYYLLIFLMSKKKIKKIFISKSLFKLYKKNIKKIKNFVVAHDASDNNFTKDYNKKKLSVGYCGHLYKGRGINIIINLALNEKAINFNILGGFKGDREFYLKKSLPKNIKFFPHRPYKNVKNFLAKNSILIAPYEKKLGGLGDIDTSKYMSPLKIFEYMSSNRPIICSNHKVLREILKPNYSALMCDPDNFLEWKSSLNKLKNKNTRFILSKNSYAQFLKKYTWNKRVKLIFS